MSFGDLTPEPSYAAGGDSMWGKLVPYSWQLLQDPAGDSPVPAAPRHWEAGSANTQIAWWSPLLHLLFYGLGWSRPDLGIATWISAGRPTDNNVLRLVGRWWGGRVEYLPAWSAQFPVLNDLGRKIHTVVADSCYNDARIQDRWEATRELDDYKQIFGGGSDSMHLSIPCSSPVRPDESDSPGHRLLLPLGSDHSRRVALIVKNYAGWYRVLSAVAPQQTSTGRSCKVDVFCMKVGFLGTYRYSRDTGRWFRGKHRWHAMGAGPLWMA